jgi:hypothetical protein
MIKVMIFGHDEELLQLRSTILALHDCQVVAPNTLYEAVDEIGSRRFDVLLLCYEIGENEIEALCEAFTRRCPLGKIVMLEHGEQRERFAGGGPYATVSAHDPDAMVEAVTGEAGNLLYFLREQKAS